jgi:hypothetical protein
MTKTCKYCSEIITYIRGKGPIACDSVVCQGKLKDDKIKYRTEYMRGYNRRIAKIKAEKNPLFKVCIFCGREFTPLKYGWARLHCYMVPCIDKAKERKREYSRMAHRRYNRKQYTANRGVPKPKGPKRRCEGQLKYCFNWIDNGNLYFCSYCHGQRSKDVIDPEEAYGGLAL